MKYLIVALILAIALLGYAFKPTASVNLRPTPTALPSAILVPTETDVLQVTDPGQSLQGTSPALQGAFTSVTVR